MSSRHAREVMLLHWLTLLAVAAVVLIGLSREWVESRAVRGVLLDIHRQLGLAIYIGTLLRVFTKLFMRPQVAIDAPRALQLVAHLTHGLLYLLLLGLPTLGLLASQARGQSVDLLGLTMPSLLTRDRDLADSLVEFHEWGAWTLVAMTGAHAAAALWHHFVRGDNTLRRMLPEVLFP